MENFSITIMTVFIMFLYGVPGYILMKLKLVEASHIKSLARILVYVFSPFMIIDTFLNIEKSKEVCLNMIYFGLATIIIQMVFILITYLFLKHKYFDAKYRMFSIGSVCGNVGFFGLPLLRAIVPDSSIALVYSSIYVCTMNLIVFTLGSFCITRNKKYISIKTSILNPTTLALFIAIIFLACNVSFNKEINDSINLLGRMTTPVCMIVLGMRLACVRMKDLFKRPLVYFICLTKLIIFPLVAYLCVYFLPVDNIFKSCILILSAVPCASVVLNLSEMYDTNQELAANIVLLTTLFSIITIPLVLLIL